MSKILLLGGEGYVGNVLGNFLLKKKCFVKSLDLLIYNNKKCVENKEDKKNYEFIYGDICKITNLKELTNDVDCIILLAGLVGDPITKKFPNESKSVNYNGIQRMIKHIISADNVKKFIFVSTCSNYGVLDNDTFATEDTTLNPVSDYSFAKVEAENLIIKNHNNSKEIFILRFSTAFGISDRMRFDLTINEFTRELYLFKKLKVFDQYSWRPYCHTYDFANVIYQIIESNSFKNKLNIYNVGSNINNSTKRSIVDTLSKKIRNISLEYLEKGVDTRNYMVNFDKLSRDFPKNNFKTIEEGIDEIIFYLNKGYFTDYDKNKNFYGNFNLNFLHD